MNVREFLGVLSKRWITVVAALAAGLAVGLAATWLVDPSYQARTQIFVSARAVTDTQQLAQVSTFGQERVQSYADIVRSTPVLEGVIDDLDLKTTPARLAERIESSSPVGTVLIDIAVRDTEPRRAAHVANSVARHFVAAVSRLETPVDGGAIPVRLSVAEYASVPDAPVSPRPALNLAAGTVGGLLLGFALAVLRETLDTTFSATGELGGALGVPVFGSIPMERTEQETVLALGQQAHSPRAEAYRQLRTNLRFAAVDRAPRLIAVTSALPGEGKTSTSVNLAAALSLEGRSVCLVDADLRRPQVAARLGLVEGAGLTSVLIGQAPLESVLQDGPGGIQVLAAGAVPPNPAELLASGQMRTVLTELAERFDAVVVDTAPVLPVADTVALASRMDGVVMVVRARRTKREQSVSAADTLRSVGANLLGVVLSMTPRPRGDRAGAYYEYTGEIQVKAWPPVAAR
ncbi:polysaccharide biosynthesis tyrosine autokinase [Streptomyces sp. NPDC001941]|uniref:polysaccharide biosynthesis tyrosine autokinase n=1 Tax=Streptomyces sp. NPDC001941 TaxID=3154659 RepID=UPI00332D3F69